MAKTIGAIGCMGVNCSKEVAVGETAGGSLSMKCGFCGFSAYAQPGTKAAREIRAAMAPMDEEQPATGSPGNTPPPEPRAATGGFQLDQLTR